MNKTSIEWTHRPETRGADGGRTWNPIRARLKHGPQRNANGGGVKRNQLKPPSGTFCTRISPGCTNCYASAINKRFGNGLDYTVPNLENVEFYLDQKILEEPLRTIHPCTIFGGDMYDMFHESIPDVFIDRAVTVVALAQWNTFQFLTKRAERMMNYFQHLTWDRIRDCANQNWDGGDHGVGAYNLVSVAALGKKKRLQLYDDWTGFSRLAKPPLPNLWLGVSVESQKYADERIPLLLQTPAAVRFLSVEPQLEAVDLRLDHFESEGMQPYFWHSPTCESFCDYVCGGVEVEGKIHWVICGGESGPKARPFDLAWPESLREQCKAAEVAFFMKQVGSNPQWPNDVWRGLRPPKMRDRKGGDPSEWPESLRVREFPHYNVTMQKCEPSSTPE